MRAARLDLNLWGSSVRVVCDDPWATDLLRASLEQHLTETSSPLGFRLQAPHGRRRLHILTDRSGFILGRARSAEHCVAVLASHLSVFAPAPTNTTRIHLRLIANGGGATLVQFPLFVQPSVNEKRLARAGGTILDRLAVDLTDSGDVEVVGVPWPELAALSPPLAHASELTGTSVTRMLSTSNGKRPQSYAQSVASLAALTAGEGSTVQRLDLAERLAKLPRSEVDPSGKTPPYDALQP